MFRKLSVYILVGSLLLGTMLTGCGTNTPKPAAELQKVRLCEVVRSIFYAPQYVAINQGFFAEEGLEIELSTGQGADKVMTALLADAADIGLAGAEAPIYVYQEGQKDYVLNFAQLTQKDGSFLVGRQAEPDFKWENLKGKTIIGGRPGGMPEMVLEFILKQHGLTPGEDVEIITNLQFTATAGAFSSGMGDYVALFEPTASLLEKEGVGHVVASLGVSSGEIPYTVFMAQKSVIEEQPEMLQKFTNAMYKAGQWVDKAEPQEIAKVIAPFFPDADLELMTQVVKRYKDQDSWSMTPVLNKDSFIYLQEIIQTAGELKEKVDPAVLITDQFANQAINK